MKRLGFFTLGVLAGSALTSFLKRRSHHCCEIVTPSVSSSIPNMEEPEAVLQDRGLPSLLSLRPSETFQKPYPQPYADSAVPPPQREPAFNWEAYAFKPGQPGNGVLSPSPEAPMPFIAPKTSLTGSRSEPFPHVAPAIPPSFIGSGLSGGGAVSGCCQSGEVQSGKIYDLNEFPGQQGERRVMEFDGKGRP